MSLMKIKDLFHFEKGSLQSTKATPGDYNFITAAADWKTHNEFTHDCEALIFAAAASGSLGRTHYVHGKFISSDLCFIITPKDPDKHPIDLKFYHLIFLAFKDEIVRNTKSGTSKESIGLTVFGNYELPYFEIAKQVETREKFVNAQKSSNKIDSELAHQLDLLTQLRQSFLREAMQGDVILQDISDEPASELLERIRSEKNRLSKDKKIKKQKPLPPINEEDVPFDIPENWVWCHFGELCVLINGDRGKNYPNKNEYVQEGIPWINTGHIEPDGTLSVSDMNFITQKKFDSLRNGKIQKGDLVYCLRGATYGKTAYVKPYETGAIASSLMIIRLLTDVSNDYVFYFLKSDYAMEQLYRFNNGSAQPNLAAGDVNLYYFPLPPLSEQERIVSKLNDLTQYCDELETSIKESQLQNEILLKQVLTEALGLKFQKVEPKKTSSDKELRTSKFDPNTTLMEIVELLKKHGKLHAEELWKMSKYPDDIDAFYAELKKQIELTKVVKESKEKGYLELV